MTTVHFVYPRDATRNSSPFCIGNEVGDRLARDYDVRFYGWRDQVKIEPKPGDVLLGHPHWRRDSVFDRSVNQPGWQRRILMAPYADDLRQVAYYDRHMERATCSWRSPATTGSTASTTSPIRRWKPKMRHMDLAVNRAFFPFVKTQFNPPGERKFLYIGHTAHNKNVGYLSQLQRQCESVDISWAGRGRKKIPGVHVLGFMDFSQPEARAVVAEFDFMITVGAMDANPDHHPRIHGLGPDPHGDDAERLREPRRHRQRAAERRRGRRTRLQPTAGPERRGAARDAAPRARRRSTPTTAGTASTPGARRHRRHRVAGDPRRDAGRNAS